MSDYDWLTRDMSSLERRVEEVADDLSNFKNYEMYGLRGDLEKWIHRCKMLTDLVATLTERVVALEASK